jgi:protein-tyrosine phosphatase
MSGLTGAISLPDGTWVRGRGLRNPTPEPPLPDFGLYLGRGRFRQRHEPTLTWRHEWIDWPDFRLPADRDAAIAQIRALHEQARAGLLVEVACGAGIGRTGTVLSCLAVLAGVAPAEAVEWTRAHYQRRAVETRAQRDWVESFPTTA